MMDGKQWNAGSEAQRIAWLSAAGVHASLVQIFVGKPWSQLSGVTKAKLERVKLPPQYGGSV